MKHFVIFGLCFFVVTLFGFSQAADAKEKTFTVAVIGAMSGPAASWGLSLERSLALAVDDINASGGIKVGSDNFKVEYITGDHKAKSAEAASIANMLVYKKKIKYIIGNVIGATTNAVQAITEPNKVIFTFCTWGTDNLSPEKPFSFREIISQWEIAPRLYEWIVNNYSDVKTVAMISPNDTSGWDTSKAVKKAAEERNLKIVADEYFKRGTTDFYPLLTKIIAKNPDIIDLSGSPSGDGGLILKQLYEMGYKGKRSWVAGFHLSRFIKISGEEAAEGVLLGFGADLEGKYATPEMREVAKRYKEKFKEPLSIIGASNYVGMKVVAAAIEKAGTIDTDKVVKVMETTKFDTAWGPLKLSGKKIYGIDHNFIYPVILTQVKNGESIDIASVQLSE
ncbi:ABC transporter substrate-binding protein [bacterium]|nr:ABC transporter substrate-binding protein [bacterium]